MGYSIFVQSKHILFRLLLPNGGIGFEFLLSESVLHWFGNDEEYDPGLANKRSKGFQHAVRSRQQRLK
jgi:hypothetical protein